MEAKCVQLHYTLDSYTHRSIMLERALHDLKKPTARSSDDA
jgi:hypothetical protein